VLLEKRGIGISGTLASLIAGMLSGLKIAIYTGDTPNSKKGARNKAGHVAQAMKQASREATILLYAPVLDRHPEAMAELADRVFCFYDMQGAGLSQGRSISEEMASQTTWEAFS